MELDTFFSVYVFARDQLQGLLAGASPLLFFVLMSVLPALGVPLSLFLLLCGGYGWGVGLVGVTLASIVNLSLSYLMAHSIARPLLVRILGKLGYRIPTVAPGNQLAVLLAVRLTPGIPYSVQNYLLGMARVSFALYMGFSLPYLLLWALAFMVLGDSFFEGDFWTALAAIALLLILSLGARKLASRTKSGDS